MSTLLYFLPFHSKPLPPLFPSFRSFHSPSQSWFMSLPVAAAMAYCTQVKQASFLPPPLSFLSLSLPLYNNIHALIHVSLLLFALCSASKHDSWLSIDPHTGKKVFSFDSHGVSETCPTSSDQILHIPRTGVCMCVCVGARWFNW